MWGGGGGGGGGGGLRAKAIILISVSPQGGPYSRALKMKSC